MEFKGFEKSLPRFLRELERNNRREWFQENKARYEAEVREPTLAFIRAMAPGIGKLSEHIIVSDSKVGGSMMRPYRDTRFGGSKAPYKTNVGIEFRHESGEDAHAPGLWMHIEPKEFWLAVGMWRPDAESLAAVRKRIAERPKEWVKARDDKRFRSEWEIVGDSLKRAPRGFDPEHPQIEDLRRTEYLGLREMKMDELYRKDLTERVAKLYSATRPYMKFLCDALGMPF